MIRLFVGTMREQVCRIVGVTIRLFEGEESGDNGLYEPLWEGFVNERVLDELGRPGLETTVG